LPLRIYETIYICPPTLSDEAYEEFSDLVHEAIYDSGGKIIKQDRWGKRRMAYKVKNFRDGVYFYILYGGDGGTKEELERRLKIAERCIRFLTVRLDKELRGKKHKIFTKEELRLALQMEPGERRVPKDKPARPAVTEPVEAEKAEPEADESVAEAAPASEKAAEAEDSGAEPAREEDAMAAADEKAEKQAGTGSGEGE